MYSWKCFVDVTILELASICFVNGSFNSATKLNGSGIVYLMVNYCSLQAIIQE